MLAMGKIVKLKLMSNLGRLLGLTRKMSLLEDDQDFFKLTPKIEI